MKTWWNLILIITIVRNNWRSDGDFFNFYILQNIVLIRCSSGTSFVVPVPFYECTTLSSRQQQWGPFHKDLEYKGYIRIFKFLIHEGTKFFESHATRSTRTSREVTCICPGNFSPAPVHKLLIRTECWYVAILLCILVSLCSVQEVSWYIEQDSFQSFSIFLL